jgi:N-acetyl-gamma-glutamyl-phosphate reductase
MTKYAGLSNPPLFAPSVGRYAQGMLVEVPLQLWALPGGVTAAKLRDALADFYSDEHFVDVASDAETAELQKVRAGAAGYAGGLDPEALNGTNRLKLFVFGNDGAKQARLVALLDNLGKGASGAAVQNLNIALGLDERAGL